MAEVAAPANGEEAKDSVTDVPETTDLGAEPPAAAKGEAAKDSGDQAAAEKAAAEKAATQKATADAERAAEEKAAAEKAAEEKAAVEKAAAEKAAAEKAAAEKVAAEKAAAEKAAAEKAAEEKAASEKAAAEKAASERAAEEKAAAEKAAAEKAAAEKAAEEKAAAEKAAAEKAAAEKAAEEKAAAEKAAAEKAAAEKAAAEKAAAEKAAAEKAAAEKAAAEKAAEEKAAAEKAAAEKAAVEKAAAEKAAAEKAAAEKAAEEKAAAEKAAAEKAAAEKAAAEKAAAEKAAAEKAAAEKAAAEKAAAEKAAAEKAAAEKAAAEKAAAEKAAAEKAAAKKAAAEKAAAEKAAAEKAAKSPRPSKLLPRPSKQLLRPSLSKSPNAAVEKKSGISREEAATKIQSRVRGSQARKKAKNKKKTKVELQQVQVLFDAAHDGTDDAMWSKKFREFTKRELKVKSDRTADVADSVAAIWKFRLLAIVEDRLSERCAKHDPELADALKGLFSAQKEIVEPLVEQLRIALEGATKRISSAMTMQSDGTVDRMELKAALKEGLSDNTKTLKIPRIEIEPRASRLATGSPRASPQPSPRASRLATGPVPEVSLNASHLSSTASGISAFAAAARLAGQPGGRELLLSASQSAADLNDMTAGIEAQATDNDMMSENPMLRSLPRHLRRTWQPNSYANIHMKHAKSRKQVDQSRPQQDLKLRQLRDIMNLVYHSKAQADKQAIENNDPKETLEHHLHTYLTLKYNGKSVVAEWKVVIDKAIAKYSRKDVEIAVFGKILENELPESFPQVQEQFARSVMTTLRSNLEEANPDRSQAEISQIWNKWDRHGAPLSELNEVVLFMYNAKDCQSILSDLRLLADKPQPAGPMEGEVHKDCVRTKNFLQVLKCFQLQLTEMYLYDFIKMFREVDVIGNSVINGHQLQDLVRRSTHLSSVMPGSHAQNILEEARNTVTQATRNIRSCTFSEAVDLCTPLISARIRAKQQA